MGYDQIIEDFIMFYPPGMIKLAVDETTTTSWIKEENMDW